MPGRPSVWIHELSFDEIERQLAADDVALIPIGATEQHGPHAPLLLDTGWAIVSSQAAAERAQCLAAPPLHYGWSHGHMAYPGCIGLRAETLTAVAVDIGHSLLQHGFRRLVFVNGNRQANLAPLEIAAVKLRMETGALAAVADCGLLARTGVAALSEGAPGTIGHAGETETSMVLAYYPELVDMSRVPAGFCDPSGTARQQQAAQRPSYTRPKARRRQLLLATSTGGVSHPNRSAQRCGRRCRARKRGEGTSDG